MTLNPIIEESINLHFRTHQFKVLHGVYIGAMAIVTVLLWPSRGFMEFFSTQTVPAAFEAIAIFQLIALSGISISVGLDRLAGSEIIRYSEWLERTRLPVRKLLVGKLIAAVIHTVVLIAIGSPFLYVSAGPAGIPVRAVISAQWVMFLVAMFCRMVGLFISLVGESREVLRITGSWVFLALLYLGTIQVFQPLNPIIAVVRQQNEASPLVSTVDPVPFSLHPAVPSSAYLLSGIILVVVAFGTAMYRHRSRAAKRGGYG
ncbi:MAG: hypothetical protein V3S41_05185 [Spirochaetia bacterium]